MDRYDSFSVRLGAVMVWTVSARQTVDMIEAVAGARWMAGAWLAACLFGSIYVGAQVWRAAR